MDAPDFTEEELRRIKDRFEAIGEGEEIVAKCCEVLPPEEPEEHPTAWGWKLVEGMSQAILHTWDQGGMRIAMPYSTEIDLTPYQCEELAKYATRAATYRKGADG